MGVVGWYVGTLGTGICGTEHPNNAHSQYALQPSNVGLCLLLFDHLKSPIIMSACINYTF